MGVTVGVGVGPNDDVPTGGIMDVDELISAVTDSVALEIGVSPKEGTAQTVDEGGKMAAGETLEDVLTSLNIDLGDAMEELKAETDKQTPPPPLPPPPAYPQGEGAKEGDKAYLAVSELMLCVSGMTTDGGEDWAVVNKELLREKIRDAEGKLKALRSFL